MSVSCLCYVSCWNRVNDLMSLLVINLESDYNLGVKCLEFPSPGTKNVREGADYLAYHYIFLHRHGTEMLNLNMRCCFRFFELKNKDFICK